MLQLSPRGLTYADAVRLLGGGDSPFISLLGRVAGAGSAAVSVATLGSVDLLAVRNEVATPGCAAPTWPTSTVAS